MVFSRRTGFLLASIIAVMLFPFLFRVVALAKSHPLPPGPNAAELKEKLAEPITCRFSETPLRDALESVSDTTTVKFTVDEPALRKVGISLDCPITIALDDAPLKSVLRLMLGQMDLSWSIRGGTVFVTAPTANLATKKYPVGDLVTPRSALNSTEANEPPADFDYLIQSVEQTVAPNSWASVGGLGTIQVDRRDLCLIISQPEEVHTAVVDLLALLRIKNGKRSVQLPQSREILAQSFVDSNRNVWLSRLATIVLAIGLPTAFASYFVARRASNGYHRNPMLLILRSGIVSVLALSGWLLVWPLWQQHRAVRGLSDAVKAENCDAVWRAAATVLREDWSREAVPVVLDALSHDRPSVRVLACDVLSLFSDEAEAAVPTLVGLLEDQDTVVRAAAANTVGAIGPRSKAAIPALIERLEEERFDYRFGNHGGGRCAMPVLTQSAWIRSNEHPLVRIGTDAISPLTAALTDDRIPVRCGAAVLLGEFGVNAREATPRLTKLLQDGDWRVRRAAKDALAKIERP